MAEPLLEEFREQLRDEARRLLVEQLRLAFWGILILAVVVAAADLVFIGPSAPLLHDLNLALIATVLAGLRAARRPATRNRAIFVALTVMAAVFFCLAAAGIVRHDATTPLIATIVLIVGIGTAFAWGIGPQLAAIAIGVACIAWNVYAVHGTFETFGHASILTILVALVASVWLAHRRDLLHIELARQNLERQQVQARRAGEERFAAIVQNSSELILIEGPDAVARYVSPAVERILGYTPREFVGTDTFTYVHPHDVATVRARLAAVVQEPGAVVTAEFRARHAGGSWIYLELVATNLLEHPEVRGVVVHARDITDRKRAEQEQAALFEIATEINRTTDFKEMLDRVQRRAAELLPCDRVVTYCWDGTRTVYRAIAWYGVPDDLVADTAALEFHPGQKIVDAALAGNTILIDENANQEWVPAEIVAHFRLTALALVPLVVHGHPLGAVVAHAESGRRFSGHQVKLLEAIAQQVGLAMEAHEVHRAQQEEAAVSAALARVGRELIASHSGPAMLQRLCELTTEILGCDYSHTWLWHPSERAFRAVAGHGGPPEQGEMIRLVALERSALVPDLQQLERGAILNVRIADLPAAKVTVAARAYGATVVLMVPLQRGDVLIGSHTAGYRGRVDRFDAQQERLARGIAHLASLALENVTLVDELQRASQLKSDFMATMSHELRTPLGIIMGYNDILIEGGFGPLAREQAEILRRTQKRAEELLELIVATLDIARLETGQVPVNLQEIDLAALLHEIKAESATRYEKPTVALLWDIPEDLPRQDADPIKLKMIIKNLVDNAMKFTEHGSVTVRARAHEEGVDISVADTGIGIAPDVQRIIFEPFRQGEPTMTRRHGGVGLGLYIVRQLLQLLGGTISLESEAGRGSVFRVWLPQNSGVGSSGQPRYVAGPLARPPHSPGQGGAPAR
jgi:PAS domain S-box-containing protein